MSSGIAVEIRGAAETAGMLRALPKESKEAIHRALKLGGQIIRKHWALALSGPAGPRKLGVKTGSLRRSITVGRVQANGTVAVGSNLPYALIHEYGFRGTVQVRGHVRTRGGKTFPVSSHRRNMRMPERPHRAPAMKDARPALLRLFSGEIDEAIRRSKRTGEQRRAETMGRFRALAASGGTGRRSR